MKIGDIVRVINPHSLNAGIAGKIIDTAYGAGETWYVVYFVDRGQSPFYYMAHELERLVDPK